MQTWHDRHNKRHTVEIDFHAAERMRDECDFDLLSCLNNSNKIEPLFQRLKDDITLPIQLLAVIEEAEHPEDFGKLFNGEAIVDAGNALVLEIIDFFPEPQKTILRKLHEKTSAIAQNLMTQATTAATEAIESPAFTTAVSELLTRGNGSNERSESSSTPAAV
jgi:hypothetical protein